jgi:hypothetical protein
LVEAQRSGAGASDDYGITHREQMALAAERLAHPPLHSVADHGAADATADR